MSSHPPYTYGPTREQRAFGSETLTHEIPPVCVSFIYILSSCMRPRQFLVLPAWYTPDPAILRKAMRCYAGMMRFKAREFRHGEARESNTASHTVLSYAQCYACA